MNKRYRSWIPGIVFWTVFLISLGLGKRYPWLDTVWYLAWMLFLFVISVYAVVEMFRSRHEADGYIGYRGVPRWAVTLFGGDTDCPKKPNTTHNIDSNNPKGS